MKVTILMGMSGCGKTTLVQALMGMPLRYAKTQTVERSLSMIDTPGEYIERHSYYRALIVSSADAELIGLVHDVGRELSWLPPSFAGVFAKPVFGIVNKVDLAQTPADIQRARAALELAGAHPLFEVSATQGTGLEELRDFLDGDQPASTSPIGLGASV